MARVTVDDCMSTIPNRFQMTLAASYRARQISAGASPMVEADRDKPTVIALREIEEGLISNEFMDAQDRQDLQEQEAVEMAAVSMLTDGRGLTL